LDAEEAALIKRSLEAIKADYIKDFPPAAPQNTIVYNAVNPMDSVHVTLVADVGEQLSEDGYKARMQQQ
jgi:hypothetical protein